MDIVVLLTLGMALWVIAGCALALLTGGVIGCRDRHERPTSRPIRALRPRVWSPRV